MQFQVKHRSPCREGGLFHMLWPAKKRQRVVYTVLCCHAAIMHCMLLPLLPLCSETSNYAWIKNSFKPPPPPLPVPLRGPTVYFGCILLLFWERVSSHRVCGGIGALPQEAEGSCATDVAIVHLNAMVASCQIQTLAIRGHIGMVAYNIPGKQVITTRVVPPAISQQD